MGCWNETDAITQQPIFVGDRCVMVLLDSDTPSLKYGSSYGAFGMRVEDLNSVKSIRRGRYDDYGNLEQAGPGDKEVALFFLKEVWDRCKEYKADDYKKYYKDMLTCNGHSVRWANIAKKAKAALTEKGLSPESLHAANALIAAEKKKPTKDMLEFISVMCLASRARIDILAALKWRGCQDWDGDGARNIVIELKTAVQRQKEKIDNEEQAE